MDILQTLSARQSKSFLQTATLIQGRSKKIKKKKIRCVYCTHGICSVQYNNKLNFNMSTGYSPEKKYNQIPMKMAKYHNFAKIVAKKHCFETY